MSGFTKLFASITESSVWVADDKTLRVWVAMLARCDARGVVEGSVPGFASLCRMSIEEFEERIRILAAPDPYSRTTDHEGRRIKAIEGGWQVLNYLKYRERGQGKDGSRAAYFRDYRKRPKTVARNTPKQTTVARNTEAEAEAEAENTPLPPNGGAADLFADAESESFNAFWSIYPNKASRVAARKAWKKVPAREHAAIMRDVERRRASPDWLKDGGQYVPHASTYLNQERWKDEPPAVPTQPRKSIAAQMLER